MGGHQQTPIETKDTIRVAVADATRMNSELMVTALKCARSNFEVQTLTSNSLVALHELRASQTDVAVISARLQDGPLTGFRVLYGLRAVGCKIPSVMLLDSSERDLVVDAFRGGARGVFCRGDSFCALPKCIDQVNNGQIWAKNLEFEFLLDLVISMRPLKMQPVGGMVRLTQREREVVRLVADGMRNLDIALQLGLSEHTVRNYLIRIFDKLGISSRVELVLYAFSGSEGNATMKDPSSSVALS